MKKIIFILLITHYSLLITDCFSQWVQQVSGVSAGLTDVEFINPNTGWICGDLGTILKTTNGGANWIIQNSGAPDKLLLGIHPVDANIVYAVGYFETILKTTNGGNNWLAIRNGLTGMGKNFIELYFLNNNTGWIVGQGFYVLRTTNGGLSFDSTFISEIFYDVYFKDNMNGLICGAGGSLYKTLNGGQNWNPINVLGENAEFLQLTFIGDEGWIVGWQNRKIYRTTNFGLIWDSLTTVPEMGNWQVSSIHFSSVNTGWVCGGAGNVYKSTNGGNNWYKQVIPVFTAYGSVFFINDTIGWCGGNSGTILHTISGGLIVPIYYSGNKIPIEYRIHQNYPNPFNPITNIKFEIPKKSRVLLTVYNVLGINVSILVNEILNAGVYEADFNAGFLPSGVYFYTLKTESVSITKKMILLK